MRSNQGLYEHKTLMAIRKLDNPTKKDELINKVFEDTDMSKEQIKHCVESLLKKGELVNKYNGVDTS